MNAVDNRVANEDKIVDAQAECILVKWNDPAEEIMALVRLAQTYIDRKLAESAQVCLMVPSHNWAVQINRACAQVGLSAVTCIPHPHLTLATRTDLAKLALLANPDDEKARQQWISLGHSNEEAQQLIDSYACVKGFDLLRAVPLQNHPELSSAMLHTNGDEDAKTLFALMNTQLDHPTVPTGMQAVPIVHYRLPIDGSFDFVFIAGCVDGLIPGPAAYEAADAQKRDYEYEQARKAFEHALTIAHKRTIVSGFTKADVQLARAAHLRTLRQRNDHGRQLAVTRMTPYLTELGTFRPSTMGGQALLKAYGLN